jgi:hypothetical protein
MPYNVPEALQLDKEVIEFGIKQRRTLAIDHSCHLVQQVLMRRLSGRHIAINVVREAKHYILNTIIDVVDAQRQG